MNRQDLIQMPQWSELFECFPVLRRFYSSDPDSHGIANLLRGVSIYFERLVDTLDRGNPFVWYNLGFNSELIYALDGPYPLPIEMLGATHCIFGDIKHVIDFIDTAEAYGMPNDCCSADRVAGGALHKKLYPPPACCVG